MVETRPPTCDELDAMLGVLCTVFEMEWEAAHEIFLKDPYFDISRKRIALLEGEVVSCLTLTHATLNLRNCPIPVTGIAGVATHPDHRSKGHAGKLVVDGLVSSRRMGVGMVGLMAHRPDYYQRFGFEVCSDIWRLVTPKFALPHWSEARQVRPLRPGDLEEVRQVREEVDGIHAGRAVRDSKRWGYVLHHSPHAVVAGWSRVEGYLLYDTHPGDEFNRIRIMECIGATPRARRALAGYLSGLEEGDVLDHTGDLHTLQNSGLLDAAADCQEAASLQRLPGMMLRVTDLGVVVKALKPAFAGFCGTLALQTEDTLCGVQPCTVLVVGTGTEVEISEPREAPNPEDTLFATPGAWAEVLSGYRGLDEAVSLGRVRAGRRALQLVGSVLPRMAPSLPSADHF